MTAFAESSRDVTRAWTRVLHAAVVRLVRILAIRNRFEYAARQTFDTCADMSSRLSSKTPISRSIRDSDIDDPHTKMDNEEGEWTAEERKTIASVFASFRRRWL